MEKARRSKERRAFFIARAGSQGLRRPAASNPSLAQQRPDLAQELRDRRMLGLESHGDGFENCERRGARLCEDCDGRRAGGGRGAPPLYARARAWYLGSPLAKRAVNVAHDRYEHVARLRLDGTRAAQALVDARQELAEGLFGHGLRSRFGSAGSF
jgi:hypothetical protein